MALTVTKTRAPIVPPQELRERPQWVVWRLEERDGKPTKVPHNARTGKMAMSTNRATWSTYEEALAFYQEHSWVSGIGFVLSEDDPYSGVDLDHCVNAWTGDVEDWAQAIVDQLRSYTEITPSGEGLRIFVRGLLPPDGGRKKGNLEMYCQARFLTVTGQHLGWTPPTIEPREKELHALHRATFGERAPKKDKTPLLEQRAPMLLSDAALIHKAREAANGAAFWALWNGDWSSSSYTSQSEADLALVSHLAFYCGPDAGRVDRLFRDSGLWREKWDERHFSDGRTYGQATIDKVLEGMTEFYTPPGEDHAPRLVISGPISPPAVQEEGETPSVSPADDGSEEDAYPIVRISDALNDTDREKPQIIEGLVWKKKVHWTFADPGTGKSLFNLALGLHIASGKPFLGRAVEKGAVLLIEEDSPVSTAVEYVELLAEIYEIDLEAIPFYVNRLQGLRITDASGLETAQSAVNACPEFPIFVIIDAVERLVPSERFTSRELDPFDRFLRWLISRDSTPSILDHTNRSGRPEKGQKQKPRPLDLLYGGRAKSAISDVLLYFDGSFRANGVVEATWEKFRVGGEPPPPFKLLFDSDTGFRLLERPVAPTNGTQQRILDLLSDWQWTTKAVIEDALALSDKKAQRALSTLTTKRWLEVRGATNNREWRRNPEAGGVFG